MESSAMMRCQSYAVDIEHILWGVFNCERFGFGGIVNSDFIRRQPFTAFFCGLAYLYPNSSPEKQQMFLEFIQSHTFYSEMSIDYLLSFETESKSNGVFTTVLDFPNGEEALISIIDAYRKLVD